MHTRTTRRRFRLQKQTFSIWRPCWRPYWISRFAIIYANLCRQFQKLQRMRNILIYDTSCCTGGGGGLGWSGFTIFQSWKSPYQGPIGEISTGLFICSIGNITLARAQPLYYEIYYPSEGLFTTPCWDLMISSLWHAFDLSCTAPM